MFIQITPEGYTPDGKCRLVPVELTEEMEWAAFSAGVQEASKERGIINRTSATYRTAIKAAPPPPAEMLEDAKKKVLMPEDMLAKARRALAHAATNNSLYQEDYDDFCAAIDVAMEGKK